jgi:hypothetical protein
MPLLGKLLLYDDNFVYLLKDTLMQIEAAQTIDLTEGASNKTLVAVNSSGKIVKYGQYDTGWKVGSLMADVVTGDNAQILFAPQ